MDAAGQQAILGLAGEPLARAMDRSHSALFTFKGTPTEFSMLQEQAVQADLMVQCGGRVCALSAPHDKASFHQVIRQTAADEGSVCILVGFGDAQNDVSMLQNSDVACIIPRPECQPLVLPNPPQFWFRQWLLRRLAGLRLRGRPCISSNRNMVNKMGDAYQDGIVATLHNFQTKSLEDLEADLKLFSGYRPMELLLPCLYSELEGPALRHIVEEISKVDYLNHVIIGLDRADEAQYRAAHSFFQNLDKPFSLLWNDGPRIQNIHSQLVDRVLHPRTRQGPKCLVLYWLCQCQGQG